MFLDIEKIIENVKQDPRTAYLDHLGQAINNVSMKSSNNTGSAHFSNEGDYQLRMGMIEKIHVYAMEVINTLDE